MKKMILFLLSSTLLLSACHSKPSSIMPLTTFHATLPVRTVFITSTGNGAKKEYLRLTPAVSGNQIYTSSYSGKVTAVNANNGRTLWIASLKEHLTTGIAVDSTQLYVGTARGEVLALNRANGRIIWRTPVSSEVLATPAVDDSYVFVKSLDDHLYALDKHTGQSAWTYQEQTPNLILRGGKAPQIAGNLVVVGFADGQVAAFNRRSGQMVWQRAITEPKGTSDVAQMVDVSGSLMISDGVIYAATYQGDLVAVSLQTGNVIWQQAISSYAGLSVDATNVYLTDTNSQVWAFNRRNGQIVWKQDRLSGRGLTGPALVGSVLVVGDSKGYIHWLSSSDGRFLARTHVDKSGFIAPPQAVGEAVYLYSNAGKLAKFQIS